MDLCRRDWPVRILRQGKGCLVSYDDARLAGEGKRKDKSNKRVVALIHMHKAGQSITSPSTTCWEGEGRLVGGGQTISVYLSGVSEVSDSNSTKINAVGELFVSRKQCRVYRDLQA